MVSLNALRKKYKELLGNITDVDIIITDTLNIDKSKLFLDISITNIQAEEIENKISRLEVGEPVFYIIGHREFMSLDFSVNPSTLIPRQDTEILIEEVINFYKGKTPFIFEIGSGSGCIAISLAHYLKGAKIISCDISEVALETAKINAKANAVSDRVEFIKHDIMKNFPEFEEIPDCIISNPPYIESDTIKSLESSVKDFEPLSALDGGQDGLKFYRQIISENNLKKGGLLAFEIGYNQGEAVKRLMENAFESIKIIKDYSNNDRVVTGIKHL